MRERVSNGFLVKGTRPSRAPKCGDSCVDVHAWNEQDQAVQRVAVTNPSRYERRRMLQPNRNGTLMSSWRDVSRLALALPETSEKNSRGTLAWAVKDKSFAWERPLRPADLAALGARAPTGPILGVRTADLEMKEMLLASDPVVYFTTPHFDGYAAVLVRLDKISAPALKELLIEAWLARAPKRAAEAFLQSREETAPKSRRRAYGS